MNVTARLKFDDVIVGHGRLGRVPESSGGSDEIAGTAFDTAESTPPPSPPPARPTQAAPATGDATERIAPMHEQVRECLRLAESTQSSGLKTLLFGMAHAWLTLAEQMKHFFAAPRAEGQCAADD